MKHSKKYQTHYDEFIKNLTHRFRKHAKMLLPDVAEIYQSALAQMKGDPTLAIKKHIYAWFDSYMNGQPAGHAYNYFFPLLVIIYFLNTILKLLFGGMISFRNLKIMPSSSL